MTATPITEEEQPHIDAICRAVLLGFDQLPLPDAPVVFYSRQLESVVETIQIVSMDEAIAARWNAHEYVRRFDRFSPPVWQQHGTVAEVIELLLELPPPDTPGAPTLGLRPSSGHQLSDYGL
jgi:hypothetical protein